MEKQFMYRALEYAKLAIKSGDVPVGAVIVKSNEIISYAYNKRELLKNAIAHAEIIAISDACKKLNTWHLDDCDMYVTLEPCPMCTGAIINSRIKTLIFGAYDLKSGSIDSVINLCEFPYNHKPEIYGGICEQECIDLLKAFFKDLRK